MRLRLPWLAAFATALAAGAAPPPASAKGTKPAPKPSKPAEWSEEEGRQVVKVFDPPLKAYVVAPPTVPEGGKKAESS